MPRRRFRRPVISRLTWAWVSACVIFAGIGGLFMYSFFDKAGVGRIAMPVDGVEYLARAEKPALQDQLPVSDNGLRLGPPDSAPSATPDAKIATASEAEDDRAPIEIIPYPDENEMFADADIDADDYGDDEPLDVRPEDFVITIDGKRQSAATARAASLGPSPLAIPDADPALLRSTPLGKVPRIGPDGRTALKAYSRPFAGDARVSRISLIVGGLGLNTGLTERAIDELPPEITLAFAPYAKDLEFWTKKARNAGHEVMIELPMEGYSGSPEALGAAALLTSRSQQENLQRLDWLMSRFGAYAAATNYLGGKFSADRDALAPIMEKLREAGVGYIDDTGAAIDTARKAGVSAVSVHRIIPPSPDDSGRNVVRRELKALENIAAREGYAVGKTYAYAATIDEIAAWARKLDETKFTPAPATTVLLARAATR